MVNDMAGLSHERLRCQILTSTDMPLFWVLVDDLQCDTWASQGQGAKEPCNPTWVGPSTWWYSGTMKGAVHQVLDDPNGQ